MIKKLIITLVSISIVLTGFITVRVVQIKHIGEKESYFSAINRDELNKQVQPYIFINKIAPVSQEDYEKYGVLPSITIAQAILESDFGRSDLSKVNNNLFGIKSDKKGSSAVYETEEVVDGKTIKIKAGFEKFNSWEDSINRHSELIKNGTTDKPDRYQKVLEAKSYKEAAVEIQKAGYATDPEYPQKLISLIEYYNLDKYD